MKNNKLIKLICGMMTGVIFILVVLGVLFATGVIDMGKTDLVIKTGGAESLYNGMPLTNHSSNIDEVAESLKSGHTIEYTFISSQTDVGECVNELQYKIVDELGADVTSDYNVKHEFGILKVNPRRILVICDDTGETPPQEGEFVVSNSSDYDGLAAGHRIGFLPKTNSGYNSDQAANGGSGENAEQNKDDASGRWKTCIWNQNGADVTETGLRIIRICDHKSTAVLTVGSSLEVRGIFPGTRRLIIDLGKGIHAVGVIRSKQTHHIVAGFTAGKLQSELGAFR